VTFTLPFYFDQFSSREEQRRTGGRVDHRANMAAVQNLSSYSCRQKKSFYPKA